MRHGYWHRFPSCKGLLNLPYALAVNKLVLLQRKYFDRGPYFPCLNGDVTVVTFTDASWATRVDGSSQGGQITLLAPKGILNGERLLSAFWVGQAEG